MVASMNVMEWRPLVLKMAVKYARLAQMQGVELDDLIQGGMLGVVLADKAYTKEVAKRWSFMSLVVMRVRAELQRLLFTNVKSNRMRNKEAPLSPEMVSELLGNSFCRLAAQIECDDFVNKLPVDEREKKFFANIVECGSMEAGRMYMQETGMTRQGMGLRRKQVVACAKQMYEEVA